MDDTAARCCALNSQGRPTLSKSLVDAENVAYLDSLLYLGEQTAKNSPILYGKCCPLSPGPQVESEHHQASQTEKWPFDTYK